MNGRAVIATAASPLLTTITQAGLSTSVLTGDTATVLGEIVRRFNLEVEPLVTMYGWRSQATNTASGGIADSNHLSATALDLNGGKHPRYRRGTFTAVQVKAIRAILADLPSVSWGGDYPASQVDDMHWETTGSIAQVSADAAAIRAAQQPKPQPAAPAALPLEADMIVIRQTSTGKTFTAAPGMLKHHADGEQARVALTLCRQASPVDMSDADIRRAVWDLGIDNGIDPIARIAALPHGGTLR